MPNLIRELRRREVFRATGLYVGVVWILIEAASVLLPAFDAPDWVMRALIIVAIIGLPVVIVLSWIFDVTDKGIEVQGDPTDTIVAPLGGRKMDFAVIGVLSVALIFSIYLNITSGPDVVEELEPISILIADFDNKTGQELFDGLLEQALNIGIESAPHITAYERNSAKKIATRLQPGSTALNSATASLVAVREGINMVLIGSIEPAGAGFDLGVAGVDPTVGRTLFEIKQKADSTEGVLQAIGELSGGVREELGDVTLDSSDSPFAETFTAASIEAARAYVNGGQLAFAGDYEAAVEAYQEAIRLDENFGRAYASLGLSAYRVGLGDVSEEAWQKALSLMETMTEREKLRTLGVYYASVTRNYSSAIENFSQLVEKYPADAPGHNNLAVVYFYALDFDKARAQGEKILNIYPDRTIFRSNFALYAMYATDFETADAQARLVVEQDEAFYKGYLPQAIAALDSGNVSGATTAYEEMKLGGARGVSLAYVGLADASVYLGQFVGALVLLEQGIAADDATGNQRAAATKHMIRAQALLEQGKELEALEAARRALELDEGDATSVAAAMLFVAAGDNESAGAIAERLSNQLQPQRRAYGAMLVALQELAAGNTVNAVDTLNAALELSDLWLIRLQLGKAYLQAGYAAEALAEFEAARSRRGEASAIFLDDVPTFRYLAELPYWTALAQFEIGMTEAARQNLESFLELRPNGGILVADARERLQ
jgi:tetratricopeptide (TPR) repeat protein